MQRWMGWRAAVAVLAFPLCSCGFHPLYGSLGTGGAPIGAMLTTIYVDQIPDRVGYELRNTLLDLFNATGTPQDAQYRLKVSLAEKEEAVLLQPNTAITRFNYTLTAHYELIPKGMLAPVKTGDVSALTAYNVAAAPFLYATVAAERDAKTRAANDIAQRIRTVLAVYLNMPAMRAEAASP